MGTDFLGLSSRGTGVRWNPGKAAPAPHCRGAPSRPSVGDLICWGADWQTCTWSWCLLHLAGGITAQGWVSGRRSSSGLWRGCQAPRSPRGDGERLPAWAAWSRAPHALVLEEGIILPGKMRKIRTVK